MTSFSMSNSDFVAFFLAVFLSLFSTTSFSFSKFDPLVPVVHQVLEFKKGKSSNQEQREKKLKEFVETAENLKRKACEVEDDPKRLRSF